MTKEQFIEAHRHEIGGWVLDGATSERKGADLAIALRGIMRKIDERLGLMYLQLVPPEPPTQTKKDEPGKAAHTSTPKGK